ncbi:protein takeout-like [Periplaneta americana]|uniref:protein takeout-like n=1 Tax=Periplaneta americana TaxID=6978 RepID=UPI0037E840F9
MTASSLLRLSLVAAVATMMLPAASAQDKEIPDFIKICKRNDPELNACITESVIQLKPALKSGVEGFLPSLEPLFMKEVLITENGGFKIVGNDVKTYGCSNFRIFNMKANMDTLLIEFDLELPHLYSVGTYDVNGRILLIPIKGNGPFTGNWTECTAHVALQGKLEDKNGYKFITFETLKIDVTVGDGSIDLQNLFGGEKVIGDAINSAVNSNFKHILRELRHPIEKALEEALIEISNDCVRDYTFDQLLPVS